MFNKVKEVAASRRSNETQYGDFRRECLYRFAVGCLPLSVAILTGISGGTDGVVSGSTEM